MDRHLRRIERALRPRVPPPQVLEQLVPSDPHHVRPHVPSPPQLFPMPHTSRQRALNQILRIRIRLVPEVPPKEVEVAPDEPVPRGRVPVPPPLQQLHIGIHEPTIPPEPLESPVETARFVLDCFPITDPALADQ